MIDPVTLINIMFGIFAVIFGLSARNLPTAIVAGLFAGLIHAGLLALVGAQTGAMTAAELPYLKDGVDYAMTTGYLTFAHARFAAYLLTIVLTTAVLMVAAYLLRWVILSILGLTPVKSATT